MRKLYIDNIRWITVALVVLYHVIYMFNGITTEGVIGPITSFHGQDAVQYLLYPWFMVLLFIISGMCARFYLNSHSDKEFLKARTRKLLVPSTIGLCVFQWIQGYFNMAISHAFTILPGTLPKPVLCFIMIFSGTGVLWTIQLMWIFSILLLLVRKIEKDKYFVVFITEDKGFDSAVDYINELYGTRCTRLDKIINIQPEEENNTKKTKGGKKKVKEEFDPLKI